MKKIKLLITLGFLGLLFLVPAKSLAADMGIQISPLTYNFEIKPGESQEAKIIVTNTNNLPLSYTLETENFSQVNNEGAPSFSGTNPSDASVTSLKDWIKIKDKNDSEGVIQPKEAKELFFDITVPEGAEPGGHYAAIFAKEVKKTEEGKTQLGVSSRVGALILVSIPGEVTKDASITKFTFPKFVWRGPVQFGMTVKNIGTTHYDSKASVDLTSIFSSKQSVDLGVHTIIPQNQRDYTGEWSNKYPFGYYKVVGTATNGNGDPVTAEGIIWAIPLIIVIPVLVGLALLIWVIKYLRHHVKFVQEETKKE